MERKERDDGVQRCNREDGRTTRRDARGEGTNEDVNMSLLQLAVLLHSFGDFSSIPRLPVRGGFEVEDDVLGLSKNEEGR